MPTTWLRFSNHRRKHSAFRACRQGFLSYSFHFMLCDSQICVSINFSILTCPSCFTLAVKYTECGSVMCVYPVKNPHFIHRHHHHFLSTNQLLCLP
ncbi:MAG: Str [Caudoviricetes sp.]|nr:MAG: Str [Caudoviricetes sp.]